MAYVYACPLNNMVQQICQEQKSDIVCELDQAENITGPLLVLLVQWNQAQEAQRRGFQLAVKDERALKMLELQGLDGILNISTA